MYMYNVVPTASAMLQANEIISWFQVEQGLKLYRAHKQQAAVRKWRGALKSIRQREDKFALLGYLYQAYMDWGKYRRVHIYIYIYLSASIAWAVPFLSLQNTYIYNRYLSFPSNPDFLPEFFFFSLSVANARM